MYNPRSGLLRIQEELEEKFPNVAKSIKWDISVDDTSNPNVIREFGELELLISKRGTDERLSKYGPGTIGIAQGDLGRYNDFNICLQSLRVPHDKAYICRKYGVNVAANCNDIVRSAQGDWIWFLGDDHQFHPNLLMNLLERDVDIVVPLCSYRKPPFSPVMFVGEPMKGYFQYDKWIDMKGLTGLQERYAAGSAGMLVKRHVFEKMPDPWFQVGRERPDSLGEDVTFCKNARKYGFKVYVDFDNVIGHMGQCTWWPSRDKDGSWGVVFDFGYNFKIRIIPKLSPGEDITTDTDYLR